MKFFQNIRIIQYISPNGLAIISVCFVFISIFAIFSVETAKDWAFAFAAGIGIGGWMFNNAVKLYSESVNRTLEMMTSEAASLKAQHRKGTLTYLRSIGGLNDKKSYELFSSSEEESVEITKNIITTLNHVEMIAMGIKHNLYNEDMLYDLSGSTYVELYELISDALPQLRGQVPEFPSFFGVSSKPNIYLQFERLAYRWKMRSLGR